MGVEYRISCAAEKLQHMQEFRQRLGGQPSISFPNQIEFRFDESASTGMPDAMACMEPSGIYFCDYCGAKEAAAVLFRRIIDEALSCSDSSDTVTISSV